MDIVQDRKTSLRRLIYRRLFKKVGLERKRASAPIPRYVLWMEALYPEMREKRQSLFLYPDPVQRSCLSEPFPNKPLEGRGFSEEAFLPLFGSLT
ncbi:MAG: hypothetical protein WBI82_07900 [Sphaerochaeta sp.]